MAGILQTQFVLKARNLDYPYNFAQEKVYVRYLG